MKLSTLLFFMFLMAITAVAQNKTLGVGVVTPNPNAALHVESPTANQGFIMPRLTTAQRTATSFVSALAAVDNGLLVYDTDLKIYTSGMVLPGLVRLSQLFHLASQSRTPFPIHPCSAWLTRELQQAFLV
jgi:hypothetical protein